MGHWFYNCRDNRFLYDATHVDDLQRRRAVQKSSSTIRTMLTIRTAHGPVEPHESPTVMTLPLQVLAVCSTIAGLIGIPVALSFGKDINFFEHWLDPVIVKTHEAAGRTRSTTPCGANRVRPHGTLGWCCNPGHLSRQAVL